METKFYSDGPTLWMIAFFLFRHSPGFIVLPAGYLCLCATASNKDIRYMIVAMWTGVEDRQLRVLSKLAERTLQRSVHAGCRSGVVVARMRGRESRTGDTGRGAGRTVTYRAVVQAILCRLPLRSTASFHLHYIT